MTTSSASLPNAPPPRAGRDRHRPGDAVACDQAGKTEHGEENASGRPRLAEQRYAADADRDQSRRSSSPGNLMLLEANEMRLWVEFHTMGVFHQVHLDHH